MSVLALSRIHFPVTTLGPGRRVGLWFQGCSIRCPGCISMDTWPANRGLTTVAAALETMTTLGGDADGLTISGGEPFEQAGALRELLAGWRARHGGDVLVYSGRALEDIAPMLADMVGLIDAVIADPYLDSVAGTLALRGSDNQRLVALTDLGRARLLPFERPNHPSERSLDVMFDGDDGAVFLAGIPRRGDFGRLRDIMASDGHRVTTTDDKRTCR